MWEMCVFLDRQNRSRDCFRVSSVADGYGERQEVWRFDWLAEWAAGWSEQRVTEAFWEGRRAERVGGVQTDRGEGGEDAGGGSGDGGGADLVKRGEAGRRKKRRRRRRRRRRRSSEKSALTAAAAGGQAGRGRASRAGRKAAWTGRQVALQGPRPALGWRRSDCSDCSDWLDGLDWLGWLAAEAATTPSAVRHPPSSQRGGHDEPGGGSAALVSSVSPHRLPNPPSTIPANLARRSRRGPPASARSTASDGLWASCCEAVRTAASTHATTLHTLSPLSTHPCVVQSSRVHARNVTTSPSDAPRTPRLQPHAAPPLSHMPCPTRQRLSEAGRAQAPLAGPRQAARDDRALQQRTSDSRPRLTCRIKSTSSAMRATSAP